MQAGGARVSHMETRHSGGGRAKGVRSEMSSRGRGLRTQVAGRRSRKGVWGRGGARVGLGGLQLGDVFHRAIAERADQSVAVGAGWSGHSCGRRAVDELRRLAGTGLERRGPAGP